MLLQLYVKCVYKVFMVLWSLLIAVSQEPLTAAQFCTHSTSCNFPWGKTDSTATAFGWGRWEGKCIHNYTMLRCTNVWQTTVCILYCVLHVSVHRYVCKHTCAIIQHVRTYIHTYVYLCAHGLHHVMGLFAPFIAVTNSSLYVPNGELCIRTCARALYLHLKGTVRTALLIMLCRYSSPFWTSAQ